MRIQSFAIIVQLAGDAGEIKVEYQVAVAAWRGMFPDVEVTKKLIKLVTGMYIVVVL